MNTDITLCLTMGKRPDLLKQTLESLFKFEQFEHVIAINDFGDSETSEVFKSLCPHGTLIDLGCQVGHHQAVDAMYQHIKTPYVFHCEDDWLFTESPQLLETKGLLNLADINSVCFRKIEDFSFKNSEKKLISEHQFEEKHYYRLDKLHNQWHGFTFNPHLAKIDLWRSAKGGFSTFKKERHISRWQRKQKKYTAFLSPGVCQHIGDNLSVSNNDQQLSTFKQVRKAIKRHIRLFFYK